MVVNQHQARSTAGDALTILGNYRRRVILAVVSKATGPLPRDVLATRVASEIHEKPASAVTDEETKESLIRLHHVDLPRLGAADLVSYDAEAGLVESSDLPLEGDDWLEMPVVEALEAWNA